MSVPAITDNFTGSVNQLTLGATSSKGGTRKTTITIGGSKNAVYGGSVEDIGHKPVIAMDVIDAAPEDWPDALAEPFRKVMNSPADWARKCVEEFGADIICIKFDGIDPDKKNNSADDAVAATQSVLKAVGVPLILWGCGNDEKNNEVMPKVSQAAKGEICLIGTVTEDIINP